MHQVGNCYHDRKPNIFWPLRYKYFTIPRHRRCSARLDCHSLSFAIWFTFSVVVYIYINFTHTRRLLNIRFYSRSSWADFSMDRLLFRYHHYWIHSMCQYIFCLLLWYTAYCTMLNRNGSSRRVIFSDAEDLPKSAGSVLVAKRWDSTGRLVGRKSTHMAKKK